MCFERERHGLVCFHTPVERGLSSGRAVGRTPSRAALELRAEETPLRSAFPLDSRFPFLPDKLRLERAGDAGKLRACRATRGGAWSWRDRSGPASPASRPRPSSTRRSTPTSWRAASNSCRVSALAHGPSARLANANAPRSITAAHAAQVLWRLGENFGFTYLGFSLLLLGLLLALCYFGGGEVLVETMAYFPPPGLKRKLEQTSVIVRAADHLWLDQWLYSWICWQRIGSSL